MLKKLQHKFMIIAFFALSSLIMVQMIAVNAVTIYQRDTDLKTALTLIAENNGRFPDNYDRNDFLEDFIHPIIGYDSTEKTPYSERYFYVEIRKNVVTNIHTANNPTVDDEKAFRYASDVFGTAEGFGYKGNYMYLNTVNGDNSLIVFIDFQKELNDAITLAKASLFIGLITMILILIPVYWLSKWAIKPIADNMQRQKQFITDAGHELKTPLAIISADAEVLEMCDGENEWLTSIKNQTERMSELVKNLVKLSKFDEVRKKRENALFNLSEAVIDTASGFEAPAKHAGKDFEVSVAPDIFFRGEESEIRQLVSILCDNALKYSDAEGIIKLSVYKSGKSTVIDMYNTCEYVDPNTVSRLFDRFYRADASRSRETGGYGIGLSIAKAIVERHKGKIRAFTNGTTAITFKIIL
ncbi:MAG: HAMP domain-containing histidine kinase [Clostridia bacterium]|nr:HAMP domain-containing histidine kinase [Clostridia bacterium]